MAHGSRHALTIAALIAALASSVAFAQGTGEEDPRFSGFTLRTDGESAPPFSDPSLADPLLPDAAGALIGPDGLPVEGAADDLSETPADPPELEPFDLFEGPEPAQARRQNMPGAIRQEPAGATSRDSRADANEADEAAQPPATLPLAGPVRPPRIGPVGAEDRVNLAASGLRPSFPPVERDAFAADGIRLGTFLLFPVIEQEVGVSDNLNNDPDRVSGAFSETRLSARLLSDWLRHEAEVEAAATYRRNFAGPVEDEPRLELNARLRIDIERDLTANLRGAVSFAREDPILADPLLPPSERPDVLAYSIGADVERAVGLASLRVGVDVVREEREVDGALAGLSGTDDFTTASIGLRAGYEIAPAFQPFVAGTIGRRMFEERATLSGLDRDSTISALRAGLAFDFGEKLSGEAAIGYAWNAPEEGGQATMGAPTLDMTVNWSPRRGTDVLLSAATYFDPDSSNLSTSTVYEGALAVRHRAGARLDLTGRLSAALRDGDGPGTVDDATYAAEAGLTYWLNRSLALTARARHERLESDVPEAEYSANSVRVGVRLQR